MAHTSSDSRIQVDYDPRTRVVFGTGSVGLVGQFAADLGRRVLVVTDAGLADAGHLGRVTASLYEAGCGVEVFDEVHPNPTTADVEACRDAAVAAFGGGGPEVVVGLGGGSSMDCAKGALFLLAGGGTIADYKGVGRGRGEFLPLITVPTTAGTGSEAQSFAVISDPQTHLKMACGDKRAAARVAVLDRDLTATMPAAVRAVTGIDAVSHAVETFVSTARTTMSQMFSRQAWRLLAAAFPKVLVDSEDGASRGDMLLGAHLAGAAIEASMLGAAHAMANPLTARYGIPHGEAIGLVLPTVVRFNAADAATAAGYAEFAELAGNFGSAADTPGGRLATIIESLREQAGLPGTFARWGVEASAVESLAAEAGEQWTGRFNPVPVGPAEFTRLYHTCLEKV